MNALTKRHIASWVLLAVYLPMLLLSSLHIHRTAEESPATCAECVQHQCHGHLAQLSDGMHQCVLCQILTLTYIAAATGAVTLLLSPGRNSYALQCLDTCLRSCGITTLRAPPAVKS